MQFYTTTYYYSQSIVHSLFIVPEICEERHIFKFSNDLKYPRTIEEAIEMSIVVFE